MSEERERKKERAKVILNNGHYKRLDKKSNNFF